MSRQRKPLREVPPRDLRPVPDFPGFYATEDGSVFVLRELTPSFRKYAQVSHTAQGRTVWTTVHRLVCAAFHGRPAAGQQAAHGNGDRWDNRADNLRWATAAENSADKRAHGRWGRRFTEEEVRAMKELIAAGARGVDVAREFKTTTGFVSELKSGKRWAHVQPQ
ncbi:HNH endonuclease signature motif containing protein [Streptomyces sp. NPDC058375]|uniref:HNH endonuclease signature motif containing protein n=1 Tax=Streptomyces sp. NPDC058375 TaxID=3346467 RepID=UPI00365DC18D